MRLGDVTAVKRRLREWEAAGFNYNTGSFSVVISSINGLTSVNFVSNGGAIYSAVLFASTSDINNNLSFDVNTVAIVIGASGNGLYIKSGTSGSGSWNKDGTIVLSALMLSRLAASQTNAGAGVSLKGAVADPAALPSTGTGGDTYIVTGTGSGYNSGDAYTYVGSGSGNGGPGNAWRNIGPLRGPRGDPGPVGPQGVPGSQGPKGDNGDATQATLIFRPASGSASVGQTTFSTANFTPTYSYVTLNGSWLPPDTYTETGSGATRNGIQLQEGLQAGDVLVITVKTLFGVQDAVTASAMAAAIPTATTLSGATATGRAAMTASNAAALATAAGLGTTSQPTVAGLTVNGTASATTINAGTIQIAGDPVLGSPDGFYRALMAYGQQIATFGGSSDPTTYLNNTTLKVRTRDYLTTYATFANGSAILNGSLSAAGGIVIDANRHIRFRIYTRAGLPTPSANNVGWVELTNPEAGKGILARNSGTAWTYMDGTAVTIA